MISLLVMVLREPKMAIFTRDNLKMATSMAKAFIDGLMALTIRGIGMRVKSREKVFMCKVMAESTTDNGKQI